MRGGDDEIEDVVEEQVESGLLLDLPEVHGEARMLARSGPAAGASSGRKQIYGTQIASCVDGVAKPAPPRRPGQGRRAAR